MQPYMIMAPTAIISNVYLGSFMIPKIRHMTTVNAILMQTFMMSLALVVDIELAGLIFLDNICSS